MYSMPQIYAASPAAAASNAVSNGGGVIDGGDTDGAGAGAGLLLSKPLDSVTIRRYLPRCMYPVRPYYEVEVEDLQSGTSASIDSIMPSSTTVSSANSNAVATTTAATAAADLFPLPLLPTADLNLNDSNIKNALDDVLARQMLLLCRLNQLEEALLSMAPKTATTVTEQETKTTSTAVSATTTIPVAAKKPNNSPIGEVDLVIHFSLDQIPYSLLAVAACLVKHHPSSVMINFYTHSSIALESSLKHRGKSRVDQLLKQIETEIGFRPTDSVQYLSREPFVLIISFVATATVTKPTLVLNAGQQVVEDEFVIARKLINIATESSLVSSNSNTTVDQQQQEEKFWQILQSPTNRASDRIIIEQLGPLVVKLSDKNFLFSNTEQQQQQQPSLVDVALWALSVKNFHSLSSLSSPSPVASSLRGVQLLNGKWQSAVRSFVTCS